MGLDLYRLVLHLILDKESEFLRLLFLAGGSHSLCLLEDSSELPKFNESCSSLSVRGHKHHTNISIRFKFTKIPSKYDTECLSLHFLEALSLDFGKTTKPGR